MAKRVKKGMKPLIRHVIRQGVREGKTRTQIYDMVTDKYGEHTPSTIATMTREEERRQKGVDTVNSTDKRRRVNLGEMVNCTDAKSKVMGYITLHWEDQTSGIVYNKGMSVELTKEGRLADILNSGIQSVMNFFVNKKYDVPEITSANRKGKAYYRLEYVECV